MATMRILSYLDRTGKTLSQVIDALPKYISSPEIKVGCSDAIKFDLVSQKIGGEIKKLYPNASYVEIDGVRMDTQNEMLIVRASQNGPYLGIKFEGKTKESYDVLKKQISDILHAFKEIDFASGSNTTALD
jgi:phosphomannomutase